MNTFQGIEKRIITLKRKKNAVILAHYYQEAQIQEIADFVGDSLELSRKAAEVEASIIVFAGVHFMGETAKILNPNKKVLVPDLEAGCSLADACSAPAFKLARELYPDHVFVTYINCSAEVKALSDIICTSANAEKIILSIPVSKKIFFSPDKNLGKYLISQTQRELTLWDGVCIVHEAFSIEKTISLLKEYPKAKLLVHPESEMHLLNIADFIGSTSAMIRYVRADSATDYLIGTESGIIHQMAKLVPHKRLIPIPTHEDNTCACSECAYMKVNTLEKLLACLEKESPEILLDPQIQRRAIRPLEKMLRIS